MRILIVEDDNLFAEILQTFVEEKNCSCVVVDSIAKAKQQLENSAFQFVLLDNHLPDGSGLHFIQLIKEISLVPVPVMMVTADDNQIIMARAFSKGADEYIVKPVSLDLLWQKIQRVHELYKKEAKLKEQAKSLERLLDKQEQEEQLARYVYEHVSSNLITETECVDTYLQSSSSFNGDVFICDTAPNGNRFVILADATGHGLSAAISILPLVTTLKAMIRKGLSLAHMVHEANKKLCTELPDDKFVTLIGVEVNFHSKTLQLFNGGMPDVIALNTQHQITRHPSTSLALGIMEPEDFDPGILSLETHELQNLFFFSDGLIEQQNLFGEAFGMQRVLDIIKDWDRSSPLLNLVVNYFTIFNEIGELQDDLSICDLQVSALMEKHMFADRYVKNNKSGKVTATITIEGGIIADSDLVGAFDGLMQSIDVVGDLRQKAFTVFAELISNALDHGVLDLDSSLKDDFAGFAAYIELKEERLLNLKENDKLDIVFSYEPRTNEISFSIKDSGKGYDISAGARVSDTALSGRGIALVNKLCTNVEVQSPGNFTSVNLKREI